MLWSLFAPEFSAQAQRIAGAVSRPALKVSDASDANPGSDIPNSNAADQRRPSMLLAMEDISKATSDPEKKKQMDSLRFKMRILYSLDVLFFLIVLVAVVGVPIKGESYFGKHGIEFSMVVMVFGLSFCSIEAVALWIHFRELMGWELTEAQKDISEKVLDDIHFDIIISCFLAVCPSYMVYKEPGASNCDDWVDDDSWDDDGWSSSWDDDSWRRLTNFGLRTLSNFTEDSDDDCVDFSDMSLTEQLDEVWSKGTGMAGLVFDLILFVSAVKNYKHIYPSVFFTVGSFIVASLQGNVMLPDDENVRSYFVLSMSVLSTLFTLRYCYAGLRMQMACCKGRIIQFNLMTFIVGLLLVPALPICLLFRNSWVACKVVGLLGPTIAEFHLALKAYGRGKFATAKVAAYEATQGNTIESLVTHTTYPQKEEADK